MLEYQTREWGRAEIDFRQPVTIITRPKGRFSKLWGRGGPAASFGEFGHQPQLITDIPARTGRGSASSLP